MQQMPKTKTIPNFFEPSPALKICDVLSDVLREPITGKIYRTVKCQVKNHSTLTKQGKCWSVTAVIADHTSSVEVCFDSEVRDIKKFLKAILPQSLWYQKREKSRESFSSDNFGYKNQNQQEGSYRQYLL